MWTRDVDISRLVFIEIELVDCVHVSKTKQYAIIPNSIYVNKTLFSLLYLTFSELNKTFNRLS